MKVKRGVVLAGLNLRMRKVLIEADHLWKVYGYELVITSALDGVHSPGSLHPYGYALDFRTRYFDKKHHKDIVVSLNHRLGEGYQVILHKTHIHVEFDAIIRKGR